MSYHNDSHCDFAWHSQHLVYALCYYAINCLNAKHAADWLYKQLLLTAAATTMLHIVEYYGLRVQCH
jgi:hypothetical protein